MNKVKVVADQFGCLLGISKNNPEYGYILVEQEAPTFNSQGWVDMRRRTALIKGKTANLQKLVKMNYFYEGKELPGKIVIKEQLDPLVKDNLNIGIKKAGIDGPVCVFEDQAIYRRTFYTENMYEEDELIQHTNVDEIKSVRISASDFMSALKKNAKNSKNEELLSVEIAQEEKPEVIDPVSEIETDDLISNVSEVSTDEVAFDF